VCGRSHPSSSTHACAVTGTTAFDTHTATSTPNATGNDTLNAQDIPLGTACAINLAELLTTLSPDEATLGLAMRVAAPLFDEPTNVAANSPPSNVFAPRRASVRA
jgi:hypothetical protein